MPSLRWKICSAVLLMLVLSLLPLSNAEPSAPGNEGQGRTGIHRRELYLHSRRVPSWPKPNTLASMGRTTVKSKRINLASEEQNLKHEDLLDCLEYHESRGDPHAVNPNDPHTPSCGCLQFKVSTWRYWECEGSIWDCDAQKKCAVKIIDAGKGATHWPNTWPVCMY